MGNKRESRASWFKIFLHQQALIDAVPDECAGKALKAALSYFKTGQVPELQPLERAVFYSFKEYIDESIQNFTKFSEAGQKGNQKRWGNGASPPDTTQSPPDTTQSPPDTTQSPPDTTQSPPVAPYREAEADTEALNNMQYVEAEETADDRVLTRLGGELGGNVVILTKQQIEMLLEKIGVDAFDYYVDRLKNYIINTGRKPKNHYSTILKWWKEDSKV